MEQESGPLSEPFGMERLLDRPHSSALDFLAKSKVHHFARNSSRCKLAETCIASLLHQPEVQAEALGRKDNGQHL
jgi:hypothetical protein